VREKEKGSSTIHEKTKKEIKAVKRHVKDGRPFKADRESATIATRAGG